MAGQRADISNAAATAVVAKNTTNLRTDIDAGTNLRTDIDAGAAIPITTGTGKVTHN